MEITIETSINASVDKVWAAWTTPEEITQWNFASEDWHCPNAEAHHTVGGKFNYRMEAKDVSMGFDFEGTFTRIEQFALIEYALEDDRKVSIEFSENEGVTTVIETFTAENELAAEQQRQGWQCILNNFKSHVEATGS